MISILLLKVFNLTCWIVRLTLKMQLGVNEITSVADSPWWVSSGSFHNSSESLRHYRPTAGINSGPASDGKNHTGVNGTSGKNVQTPAAGANGRSYQPAANGRNYHVMAGANGRNNQRVAGANGRNYNRTVGVNGYDTPAGSSRERLVPRWAYFRSSAMRLAINTYVLV